jgi:Autotransporter beta-domain
MFRIIALAAAACSIGLPALANDLEDTCQNAGQRDSIYVCATALEFGGQASDLREMLLSRHFGATPAANGVTVSTSGTDHAISGLLSMGAQATGGSFSGDAQVLSFGVDRGFADAAFIGVMLQYGNSNVTAPGSSRVTRREFLLGPYFSTDLGGDLFLDGTLLLGAPDYTVAMVPSQGNTALGVLTLAKAFDTEGIDYVIFSSLSAKREKPTAGDRIDATVLTLGGRLRFEDRRIATGWQQNYARLELDIGRYADSLGAGSITYVSPRVAVGTDIAFDNGGSLNLSAHASAASDRTYVYGVQGSYLLRF